MDYVFVTEFWFGFWSTSVTQVTHEGVKGGCG